MMHINKNDNLDKLYKFIGYKIRDDYALTAITCSNYANENHLVSQDALAVVGDHVLKQIITSNSFKINDRISKKEITNHYQTLETNKTLEKLAGSFHIQDFLFYLNTDLDGNKKLATSLEAIIGAIYLSEGLERTEIFIQRLGLVKLVPKSVIDIIDRRIFDNVSDEIEKYGYESIVLCVIDSIYSISATYQSTKNTVKRFVETQEIKLTDQYKTSEFISTFGNKSYDYLANYVFQNRQRTSAKNGILKAEAVVEFIKVLNEYSIETKEDLLYNKNNEKLVIDIKAIKGQSKGTTFDYLLMQAGDQTIYKRDRHIINFFSNYLNVIDTSYENLMIEFQKQLHIVRKYYPNFSIRTLDSVIWNFMSKQK